MTSTSSRTSATRSGSPPTTTRHSRFYGRSYVTWTSFIGDYGEYVESPILESHSDDGGKHWTKPQEISGSNAALCTFQTEGRAGECDEDQASVADGRARRHGLRRVHEQPEPGALGAGRGSPMTSTSSSARGTAASTGRSPSFVVGHGGRLARLPAQRRRPPDAHRLPGARLGRRQHRRRARRVNGQLYLVFSDNRNGLHDTRPPGHQLGRLRRQLDERRQELDAADARRPGRGRPVVPVGGRQPAHRDSSACSTTTAAPRTARHTRRRSPRASRATFVKSTISTAPVAPDDVGVLPGGRSGLRVLRHLPRRLHRARLRHATATRTPPGPTCATRPPFTPGLFFQFIYYARK